MWSTNTEYTSAALQRHLPPLTLSPTPRALEAASLLGGKELVPFYSMLEGGRDGEFFHELEDFFYYAQIRRLGCTAHSNS